MRNDRSQHEVWVGFKRRFRKTHRFLVTLQVNNVQRTMFLEATSLHVWNLWAFSYWTLPGGRSPEVPESVHRLRPGDIDVIAAMGDSLTAGAGLYATNLLEVFIENRGASAFIGGQGTWRTHLTLPNILKVWIFRFLFRILFITEFPYT